MPPVSAQTRGFQLWIALNTTHLLLFHSSHSLSTFSGVDQWWSAAIKKKGICIQMATQWIRSTGDTPVNVDQCKRTCGQNEGLRGSLGEGGRGVVAVPAVWVKRSEGQMRSKVRYWPWRQTRSASKSQWDTEKSEAQEFSLITFLK